MVQCPSTALFRELGEASLAVALVGSSVANRVAAQASAFNAEVLDHRVNLILSLHSIVIDDNARGMGSQGNITDQVPPKILDNAIKCDYTD